MNHVTLFGYTGKDVKLRTLTGGGNVAQFSIGTDESYFDKKTNAKVKKTEWHNCVQFGKGAETTAKYVSKGSQILVEGKLQTRTWDDRDGNKKSRTEIVVQRVEFGRLKDSDRPNQTTQGHAPAHNQGRQPGQDDEPIPNDEGQW